MGESEKFCRSCKVPRPGNFCLICGTVLSVQTPEEGECDKKITDSKEQVQAISNEAEKVNNNNINQSCSSNASRNVDVCEEGSNSNEYILEQQKVYSEEIVYENKQGDANLEENNNEIRQELNEKDLEIGESKKSEDITLERNISKDRKNIKQGLQLENEMPKCKSESKSDPSQIGDNSDIDKIDPGSKKFNTPQDDSSNKEIQQKQQEECNHANFESRSSNAIIKQRKYSDNIEVSEEQNHVKEGSIKKESKEMNQNEKNQQILDEVCDQTTESNKNPSINVCSTKGHVTKENNNDKLEQQKKEYCKKRETEYNQRTVQLEEKSTRTIQNLEDGNFEQSADTLKNNNNGIDMAINRHLQPENYLEGSEGTNSLSQDSSCDSEVKEVKDENDEQDPAKKEGKIQTESKQYNPVLQVSNNRKIDETCSKENKADMFKIHSTDIANDTRNNGLHDMADSSSSSSNDDTDDVSSEESCDDEDVEMNDVSNSQNTDYEPASNTFVEERFIKKEDKDEVITESDNKELLMVAENAISQKKNAKTKKKQQKRKKKKERKEKSKKEKQKNQKENQQNDVTLNESSTNYVTLDSPITSNVVSSKDYSTQIVKKREDNVVIEFFITLLPQFAEILNNHFVCVLMEHDWKLPLLTMRKIRHLDCGSILLHGTVSVPRYLVRVRVCYKYLFHKKASHDYVWEEIYTGNNHVSIVNRTLKIPEDYPQNQPFYQIDDIIIPGEKMSLSKKFIKFVADIFTSLSDQEKQKQYNSVCTNVFLEIMELCYSGELPLKDASPIKKMLFLKGLYMGFFNAMINVQHIRFYPWKKINNCHQIFLDRFEHHLSDICRIKNSSNGDEYRNLDVIVNSLPVAILLNTCGLKEMSGKLLKCFFDMLSIQDVNLTNNELQLCIQEKYQKNTWIIEDSLKSLWEHSVVVPHNVSSNWCDALNILHCMNGLVSIDHGTDLHKLAQQALFQVSQVAFKADFLDNTFSNLQFIKTLLKSSKMLQVCLGHLMNVKRFQLAIRSGYFDDAILISMMSGLIENEKLDPEKCDRLTVTFTEFKTKDTVQDTILDVLSALIDFASHLLMKGFAEVSTELYTVMFDAVITYDTHLTSVENSEQLDGIKKEFSEKKSGILKGVNDLFYNHHWNDGSNEELIHTHLKLLDVLLCLEDLNMGKLKGIKEIVLQTLTTCTEDLSKRNTEMFLNIYGSLEKSYDTSMHAVFQAVCEKLLKKMFSESCEKGIFEKVLQYFVKEDNCFINTFCKEWEKHDSCEDKLKHMLSWPPMTTFLDFFSHKEKPQAMSNIFEQFSHVVKTYFQKIRESSATLREFDFLRCRKENYENIFKQFLSESEYQNLVSHFDKRIEEIALFRNTTNAITYFLDSCKKLPEGIVNLNRLHEKVQEDHQAMELKKIFADEKGIRGYYNVGDLFMEVSFRINQFRLFDSKIFKKFWKKGVENIGKQNKILDQSNVIEELVIPAQKKLLEFLDIVLNGDYPVRKLRYYFKSKESEIRKELDLLMKHFEREHSNPKKLVSKIHCALTINDLKELALEIQEVRQELPLKGDFDFIYSLLEKINKHETMLLKDLKEEFVHTASKMLKKANETQSIISAILKNLQFVRWLRSEVKGSHEVKTSIAILKNAAGDEPMQVQIVRCFEECCAGFSSIFFELTENCGYSEFCDACETSSQNSKQKKLLLESLDTCNSCLEWIKESYKSQKSFAAGAYYETETANRHGCYVIGLNKTQIKNLLEEKAELSSIVTLNISVSDIHKTWLPEEIQVKSLNDIHDLQSRLMLLGGENQFGDSEYDSEISFFLQHAEIATRLGSAFIALYEAGDDKYLEWKKEIPMDIEEGLSAQITVADDIQKLENRLRDWKKEFCEFRKNCPLANYFNNKQCLYLRKHLHCLTKTIKNIYKLPPQVFILLQSIKSDITTKDIEYAFQFSYIGENTQKKNNWKKVEVENDNNFVLFSIKEIKKFLDILSEHGIDENIALASVKQICPFEIEKAIIWCKKQDPDDDNIDNNAEVVEEEMKKFQHSQDEIEEEEDTQQPNEKRDGNFLQLQQFGDLLNALDRLKQSINRRLPSVLNENERTSLVILPKADTLKSIIQIYLENDGELPKPEEVFLCDENVTIDQVDLFLLRASQTNGGLYCMAFADCLEYSVTEAASEMIENYKGQNHLIIMCTIENENQSLLSAKLKRYSTKQFVMMDESMLSANFQKKLFQADKIQNPKIFSHASSVDDNFCCARVVVSKRGGMGKTLYVEEKTKNLKKKLKNSKLYKVKRENSNHRHVKITVPVHGIAADVDQIVECLSQYELTLENSFPRIYHFDIAPSVYKGLENLFFKVAVLGSLQTSTGKMWRRNETDMCLFEVTNTVGSTHKELASLKLYRGDIQRLLPQITCLTPYETILYLQGKQFENCRVFTKYLYTEPYNKVLMHLSMHEANDPQQLMYLSMHEAIEPQQLSDADSLYLLLRKCGIENPSWLEVQNFVYFLNKQLKDSENSCFTSEIHGFQEFVVKFLLQMAKDFATRSLQDEDLSGLIELKRRWEQSHHPYLFFNNDGITFTFFGFRIVNGDLLDQETDELIEKDIMTKDLYEVIVKSMQNDIINFETDFEKLDREVKLTLLCRVMGLDVVTEPDATYELTNDNMKKILAIYTRLRCDIPVVLMGETGCGKTRLIRFMCALRAGNNQGVQNMILVKMHGGVTVKDIVAYVESAKKKATENYKKYMIKTVLFFDEVNTSDAIGLVKEVMIDRTVLGKPVTTENCALEIIAACNPYRRHSDLMVEKLKASGLGYHVGDVQTYEKIGNIPLRQLVYRVHPLPESLKSLVWDFGQLSNETELAYSSQIIQKYMDNQRLPRNIEFRDVLIKILTRSQMFMRRQENECSFVSLRDVERAVQVTAWFFKSMKFLMNFIKDFEDEVCFIRQKHFKRKIEECNEKLRRSLVLAVGVCYIARLEERDEYIDYIVKSFTGNFALKNGSLQLKNEIERFQKMFVHELQLEDNIAKNQALCENIFMMVVCIELRIPLFIVGKPGSSKSLAKTIVEDHMQGNASKSKLFKNFKRIDMTSYQCSPLSTAEGIIAVFQQASKYQTEKKLDEFSSVVVLDEVGLAEDSPRMPLKALHPLLEDGTDGSEDLTLGGSVSKDKRVAFIGISNWSLDPAKMNRGIMLCRNPPDLQELEQTARDICASDNDIKTKLLPIFKPLAKAYCKLYNEQKESQILNKLKKEEFFGLRDFYCLIKMVFCYAKVHQKIPPIHEIELSVRRNFSGLEEIDPWEIFKEDFITEPGQARDVSTVEMIKSSISPLCPCAVAESRERNCTSSRYLLIMTENFSALSILEGLLLETNLSPRIIFGSSFPKDQEFTQVCRDINEIKMCMETGQTVVLLNMEKLYESLYDALNQYYVYLGGERFVDLGLGTHRVKCKVHNDFKLIVIADKKMVYETFPIPLINRLEKHIVMSSSSLNDFQKDIADQLNRWANGIACIKGKKKEFGPADAFIGFNEDTCASIVIRMCHENVPKHEMFEVGKRKLLKIATPDAVLRVRKTSLRNQKEFIDKIYFNEQQHICLHDFLEVQFNERFSSKFMQVTTFSRLLSEDDLSSWNLRIDCHIISLVKFQTEYSFRQALKAKLQECRDQRSLLIIQYNIDEKSGNIVACAQHICKELLQSMNSRNDNTFVLFLLQLSSAQVIQTSLSGFQSFWECVHIDDVRRPDRDSPSFLKYCDQPASCLFEERNLHHVMYILKSSLQPVLKEINASKPMTPEVISRKIKILQSMIDEDSELSTKFIVTIANQIYQYRKKKEEVMRNPKFWIPEEACDQDHLPYYVTFRAALVSCLEDLVIPIWKDLLFIMDCYDNLLLLGEQNSRYLWVDLMFFCFESGNLLLDQDTPLRINKTTNHISVFPFSKLINDNIEKVLETKRNIFELQDKDEVIIEVKKVIELSSFSPILKNLSQNQLENYLLDFLSYQFAGLKPESYELLRTGMLIGMEELKVNLDPDDFDNNEDKIALAYMTFEFFYDELSNSSKILRSKPNIINKVDRRLTRDEMVLDLDVLKVLLKSFQPSNELVRKHEVGLSGNKELKETSRVIKEMLSKPVPNDSRVGKASLMKECKILWMQLRLVQTYEDNVLNTLPVDDRIGFEKDTVFELWKLLRGMTSFMDNVQSWNQLDAFLRTVLHENDQRNNSKACHPNRIDSFKKHCTRFFVDVVSEFGFAKEILNGSKEVINLIMDYTFTSRGTKQFSPLQDDIDQSPVVRSFILQQLLRKEIQVSEYLKRFLEQNLRFAVDNRDIWNISKLFIYCFEDHLDVDAKSLCSSTKFNEQYLKQLRGWIGAAVPYFNQAKSTPVINVELLQFVAKARLAISCACDLLCSRFLTDEVKDEDTKERLKSFFPILMNVINLERNSEIHMFVLRQIVHKHGYRELKEIVQRSEYNWLDLADQQNRQNVDSDKFLVYGQEYQNMRNKLTKIYMERNPRDVQDLAERITEEQKPLLHLALLRETVLSESDLNNEIFAEIISQLGLQYVVQQVNIISRYHQDRVIMELLYHFLMLINHSNSGSMQLYYLLYAETDRCQNLFFPTMPSDNFEEIARVRPNDHTAFVPHACPNGHIYIIGDCGRAATTGTCPECGSLIGGTGHRLLGNNRRVDHRDETRPGHSLGEPAARVAAPERKLTILSVTLQRLLLHLAMLAGSLNNDLQRIQRLVTPQTRTDIVSFLTAHLQCDLRFLRDALGKSSDDARFTAHLFLKHLNDNNNGDQNDIRGLLNKQGRVQFEMAFHTQYIERFQRTLDQDLDGVRRLCVDDMRMGGNPLMRKLYELDLPDQDSIRNISPIRSPQLWRYRLPLSVEDFRFKVQERRIQTNGQSNRLLHIFLNDEWLYQQLNELPKLLKFQQILYQQLNYRVDKETAHTKPIKIVIDEIKNKETKNKLKKLKNTVFKLWNKLSNHLKDNGPFKPDVKFHPDIMNDATTLEYFLVCDVEAGRCLKSVITFLIMIQNELLHMYAKTHNSFLGDTRKLADIQDSDVIAYKREEHLLPIMQLNCNYSLEIGKGTRVEYSFDDIERKFFENICFGKCPIETPVQRFFYQDDVHKIEEFNNFFLKVKQTSIPFQNIRGMMSELKAIDDVSNTLKAVETTIGFLSKTGGPANHLYVKYLEDTLSYNPKKYLPSAKMRRDVRLTHLYSTWKMLTVERALRLLSSKQNPFSSCNDIFKVPFPDNQLETEVENKLTTSDHVHSLICTVNEYIVCDLPLRGSNDADLMLSEALDAFESSKKYKDTEESIHYDDIIPDEVKLANICAYWMKIATIYQNIC